jgi:hypothetical protein
MALQAREYEKRYLATPDSDNFQKEEAIAELDLQPFFNSSIPRLRSAEVKGWGTALEEERNRASASRGS